MGGSEGPFSGSDGDGGSGGGSGSGSDGGEGEVSSHVSGSHSQPEVALCREFEPAAVLASVTDEATEEPVFTDTFAERMVRGRGGGGWGGIYREEHEADGHSYVIGMDTRIAAHMNPSTHVYKHACTQEDICTSTHVHKHTNTHSHTYTSTHMHKHTLMHAHKHGCT